MASQMATDFKSFTLDLNTWSVVKMYAMKVNSRHICICKWSNYFKCFETSLGGIRNESNTVGGNLISPLYPNSYPWGIDCTYVVSFQMGSYVKISDLFIDIECEVIGTTNDYLEMRDGNVEGSPVMARLCGNNITFPTSLQTTQNYLRIR